MSEVNKFLYILKNFNIVFKNLYSTEVSGLKNECNIGVGDSTRTMYLKLKNKIRPTSFIYEEF